MGKPNSKNPFRLLKAWWRQQRQRYNDTLHHSFKMTPQVKRRYKLQGVREGWQLILDSFIFLRRHSRKFLWLTLLYGVVAYFLVGGISQFDYVSFRQSASEATQGNLDAVSRGLSLFGTTLMGALNQEPTELQKFLSSLIAILFLLVTIWLVRMLSADKTVKLRDAFYNGPAPLLSLIIVLAVMVLQLVPAGLGFFAFAVAFNEQWITNAAIGLTFAGAAILLCVLSAYWLSGSLIATMVVALPGMYPFKALASARMLIVGKRWTIVARIFSAAIIQLLIWAVILFPTIMLEGWLRFDWLPLVPVVVQCLNAFTLLFSSVYLYKLYRSLL
jgi:hypothetical protein